MEDCLFCKMARGEIRPDIVLETDDVLAFRDLNPQAPVHVLVIPRKHIESMATLEPGDTELIGKVVAAGAEVARREGIAESGYRAVMNTNADGGQSVYHLHLHVLGGRQLGWPPG
ncbi:MAG: histidine triad nucleotide-binding protein [Pseudomonadota bacterium]